MVRGPGCCWARGWRRWRGPTRRWCRAPREDLQTWVALHAQDAGAWLALAQVNERQGAPLAALRAHAEVSFAQGDLAGAVDRLRAGQRLARSKGAVESMEGVIIESRLKAVEQQRRIEMEQERNGQSD